MSEQVATRVVVWSTGGVGSNAIRAVARRTDLDLVGVWVHTPEKVGRDAGELAGIEPLGVSRTDNAAALIALRPDCVIFAASGPERGAGAVHDYVQVLDAGVNVVTSTSTGLVFPPASDCRTARPLAAAAEPVGRRSTRQGSSLGSPPTSWRSCSPPCRGRSGRIKVIEVSLNDHYPVADVMMDGLGSAVRWTSSRWSALPG